MGLHPTGNELPAMFQHWSKLREMLGGTFTPSWAGRSKA